MWKEGIDFIINIFIFIDKLLLQISQDKYDKFELMMGKDSFSKLLENETMIKTSKLSNPLGYKYQNIYFYIMYHQRTNKQCEH